MLQNNNNKPESESFPISLSSSSSFCRHLQQFPIFKCFEINSLSTDKYFSSDAEYFIFRQIMFFGSISKSCPRQNSFSKCVMRFYYFIKSEKRFLLSAFGGLFHSGKKTIFSWWLIWMTRVRKVTDSNSYLQNLKRIFTPDQNFRRFRFSLGI